MRRSPPSCCLRLVTSAATSPRTTVEVFHSAVSSFDEKTYLRCGDPLAPGRPLRKSLVCGPAPQDRVARREGAQPVPQTGIVVVVPEREGIVQHYAVRRNQAIFDDLPHRIIPLATN